MFAVTELNEGLDAIKGTGDDPLIEELADAAIRILDILTSCFADTWADRTVDLYDRSFEGGLFEPGEVALWRVLGPLCGAVEDWRYERVGDVRIGLEIALREIFTMSLMLGVELRTVIVWKNERNSRRGIRHGKVRSEG
jgi:hypothetical protein